MHHKKLEEQSEQQQIRNETTSIFISSDFSNPQNTNKKRTHVHVQVPENQTHFRHESIPSKPHKKSSMMNQAVFHSLPFFSCKKNQRKSFNFESCKRWSFYCSSFATNSFAHKLAQSFYSICLLRFHLRFLILFSLPSLYFFFINPRRFLLLNFLFILSFFICLLVLSLSCTLHRFPSLRILLSRTFPIKFTSLPISSSNSNPSLKPVIWSIGSKPKLTKNPNSGSWVKVYSNGDVYEGEFHKGKCSGSGVYYYYKKGRYEGDWIDGKYDGYGVETWARGSRYRGQYIQGLRHGIGVYRFYTGDVYAGEWSNGQCHGCGVHTCDDGSRYVGEFKWGVKHGLGYYHFRNGDTYSGEYFADRMHGFGVYKFGNGHRYEGAWHEGTRQGLGMYSFRNGETQAGHWQNGVLDIATSPTTVPTSSYGISYSKVLTAVQEAQRAAAKAHNLVRIEERVTRAVAAANKAANAARVASIKAVQNQMHQHESEMHPLQASYP